MTKFKAGDRVIIGRHTNYYPSHGRNWTTAMEKYVGKIATLVIISSIFEPYEWIIDIDRGQHTWREQDMLLAYLDEKQVCAVCKISCPHEKPNQKDCYICAVCIVMKDLE